MFLYILSMTKKEIIKIGISISNDRILNHVNTYKNLINLKESFIIKSCNKATIKLLEQTVLNDYRQYKIHDEEFNKLDGYTELRSIKALPFILEDIEHRKNRFINDKIEVIKDLSSIKPTKCNLRLLYPKPVFDVYTQIKKLLTEEEFNVCMYFYKNLKKEGGSYRFVLTTDPTINNITYSLDELYFIVKKLYSNYVEINNRPIHLLRIAIQCDSIINTYKDSSTPINIYRYELYLTCEYFEILQESFKEIGIIF